jgi:heavy metal sensor kinase
MKKFSIGSRLTFWYVLMFAGAQFVFGIGMWLILHHKLYDIADDQLEAQIDDVRRFLRAHAANASTAKLREDFSEIYLLEHSGDYLQVQDEQGNWIYRSSTLDSRNWAAPDSESLRRPLYEDYEIEGQPYRFLSEVLIVDGYRFTVETGVEDDDVVHTLRTFRDDVLAFALLMLGVASGVGYWLSRKALAPIDAITSTARSIGGTNLSSRLTTLETNDELQRLSDTLNQMLARIETSFQRVSQFTADASHELRTPISLMRTEAEIALRKSRNEDEYRDALRHILIEAERTSALIDDLLSLARADAGRESLDMKELNLCEVVASVEQEWRKVMSGHHLEFTMQRPGFNVFFTADDGAIRRLLNILLDNAAKYTPRGGAVTISLSANDNRALLAVSDTGIGINDEDKAHVFERFYRADKARNRESGGSGLGLAIAHWIVQKHNGTIEVDSTIGQRTVFTISLPRLLRPNDPTADTHLVRPRLLPQ